MLPLNRQQQEQFQEQGYLIVEDVFNPETDFEPLVVEYDSVLDRLANELYSQRRITSLYKNKPFGERLIQIYRESGQVHAQYFNPSLPPDGFTEKTPYWAGKSLFQILRHKRLLDAVESILGPEIYVTPILHARIKPPESLTPRNKEGQIQLGKTMIHQDNAGMPPEADQTEMLIVWFPLQDANIENGCLCVWPGSHHRGVYPHRIVNGRPKIPAEHLTDVGKAVAVPVKRGNVLFMHRCLLHASYANNSKDIRWSFDFRYNPTHQPKVREFFPGFVARSRAHPETELHDPIKWNEQWQQTRYKLAKEGIPQFHRWS